MSNILRSPNIARRGFAQTARNSINETPLDEILKKIPNKPGITNPQSDKMESIPTISINQNLPNLNYSYNFDFSKHSQWDKNVSIVDFNNLVNLSANKSRNSTNADESFREYVRANPNFSNETKKMVSLFLPNLLKGSGNNP